MSFCYIGTRTIYDSDTNPVASPIHGISLIISTELLLQLIRSFRFFVILNLYPKVQVPGIQLTEVRLNESHYINWIPDKYFALSGMTAFKVWYPIQKNFYFVFFTRFFMVFLTTFCFGSTDSLNS